MGKELKRSKDKKLFGVAAGIAEYFDVDITIVRIIWAILILAYGTAVIRICTHRRSTSSY